jgi:hypothetical protein
MQQVMRRHQEAVLHPLQMELNLGLPAATAQWATQQGPQAAVQGPLQARARTVLALALALVLLQAAAMWEAVLEAPLGILGLALVTGHTHQADALAMAATVVCLGHLALAAVLVAAAVEGVAAGLG